MTARPTRRQREEARDLVDRLWAVDVCDRKAVPIVRSALSGSSLDAAKEG